MSIASVGAPSVPRIQAAPPTRESSEAPGINDHDADDVAADAAAKAAPAPGTGAIVDKTA